MDFQPERNRGLYTWLRHPYVYDAFQSLTRGRRSRADFVADFVRPKSGDRVLDVGCGTATVLEHLPGVRYTGIDSNEDYIRIARRRFGGASGPDAPRFICADVESAFDDRSDQFDVAIALGVFHHLADDVVVALCRNVGRLLASGGRLVTHDPVLTPDQGKAARWFVEHDRGRHVRTEDDYLTLLRSAGLNPRSTITHTSLRIPYSEIMVEATVV